jgi:predicted Zn-dependent protease
VLEEGLSEHPNSIILLVCSGEVHSQAGDMVNALENFERANKLDARNPLPFVNAARTYQQLGQLGTASSHLQHAIHLDPALSMTRVDLAQNYMQSGRTEDALDMLNVALSLARQVSEIRDVLTAKSVATMQLKLEKQGLYIPASTSV